MKTTCLKKLIVKACLALLCLVTAAAAFAQTDTAKNDGSVLFRFKFKEGDTHKIHSVVNEKVFVNGVFHHDAQIVNRITAETLKTAPAENGRPASGLFSCTFMTSEQNSNKTFDWSRRYPSKFIRDGVGTYTIEDKYFMPVVRNLPIFPEKPVKPSETWTKKGYEAHDFRDAFGIQKPFTFPFDVEYQYVGLAEINGVTYHHITAKYNLDYTVPDSVLRKYRGKNDTPVKTLGFSRQNLYWDSEKGNLIKYNEEFEIKLVLYSGHVLDFIGSAYADVIETQKLEPDTAEELKKTIEDSNLENTNVKKTEEGITVSIEKIQFLPDSAVLMASEKEKLKKIANILSKFSDKEFLISGHTAFAGTKEERQALSEERAAAVANYLIELGLQTRDHVYTRGFGAQKPLFPNNSEENRAKNRRVEITILED